MVSEKEQLLLASQKTEESLVKEKQNSDKLQASLNNANDKEVELDQKIKELSDKLTLEEENGKLLKQAKNLVQEEKAAVEKQLEDKTVECQDLNVLNESSKFRIKELEQGLKDTEDKVNEMRSAIEEAVGKERNLLSDIEEKNKTIFAIEEEKANIVISFESQQTILERLTSLHLKHILPSGAFKLQPTQHHSMAFT